MYNVLHILYMLQVKMKVIISGLCYQTNYIRNEAVRSHSKKEMRSRLRDGMSASKERVSAECLAHRAENICLFR